SAADDGATFIVGPLTKDEVQAAADARIDVPMLLLNTLPGSGGGATWQFALAPEDEARQIARRLGGGDGSDVVVLAPAGEWGQRVAAALADELRQAGGRVAAEGYYDLSRNNVEATLVAALGIDASRARRDRVQSAIGAPVQAEVRPSPHIDAIFVAGFQSLAMRQVRPYLRQYNADHLATYMTSDGVDA